MAHNLSAAFAALRREKDLQWAETQRRLAESTGDPENIAAVERAIERRMGKESEHGAA